VLYNLIYDDKISQKGYKKVELEDRFVGSASLNTIVSPSNPQSSRLPTPIQDLVTYIYKEATKELMDSKIAINITEKGLLSPLGILTDSQIDEGNQILIQLYELIKSKPNISWSEEKRYEEKVVKLSDQFYSIIPHQISANSGRLALITTPKLLEEKQRLLELMRDLHRVRIQSDSGTDMRYKALKCDISLEVESTELQEIKSLFSGSNTEIITIFKVRREEDQNNFTDILLNTKLLFHGSKIGNWLGILSHGILPPSKVMIMGGSRTDYGFLGNGLYFTDSPDAASKYCTYGFKGTKLILICRVALGVTKQFSRVEPALECAPLGYHSVIGTKPTFAGEVTDFEHDEFVIYNTNQLSIPSFVDWYYR